MTDKDSSVRIEHELDVVRRAQQGDRDALVRLFDEHLPTVHRFAMRMCRDEDHARDVAQESLLTALKSLKDYRGEASFSTWLFTIARSHCGKTRRRQEREPLHSDEQMQIRAVQSDDPAPDAQISHAEISDVVERGLADIDPAEREAVLLRDVEGMSANEASRVLNISVAALKSRLHRGRAALRDRVRAVVDPHPESIEPSCPDVIAALSSKIEGDLPEDACSALEAHVASCPSCAARCESVRRVLGACSALRRSAPSAQARKDLEKIIASIQRLPGV
jgi:RNA polymerase sigma-70 factor, ECF subfamily